METLNQLNEAVKKIIEITNSIHDETNAEIWNKAPIIIHQRFCSKLVEVTREQSGKAVADVPKAVEILTAINILEELYPGLAKE
jgi:hypothetical protein